MSKKRLRNYKNLKIAQTESVLYFSFDRYTPFYLHEKKFFFFKILFFLNVKLWCTSALCDKSFESRTKLTSHIQFKKPLHFSLQFQFFFNGSLQKKLRRWLSWLWLWQGIFFHTCLKLRTFQILFFFQNGST